MQKIEANVSYQYTNSIGDMLDRTNPKDKRNTHYIAKNVETMNILLKRRDLKKNIFEHRRDVRAGNDKSDVFRHVRYFTHVIDLVTATLFSCPMIMSKALLNLV